MSISYNRYLYGRGNPISNNDPTGHVPCNDAACYNAHGLFQDAQGGWTVHGEADFTNAGPDLITAMMNEAGIAFTNGSSVWAQGEINLVLQGIVALANKLSNFNNETGLVLLNQMLGGSITSFHRLAGDNYQGAAAWVGLGRVPVPGSEQNSIVKIHDGLFAQGDAWTRGATAHELAHVADFNSVPYRSLSSNFPMDANFNAGNYVTGLQASQAWLDRYNGPAEYFAELVGIWVYEPSAPGGFNPYANAIGSNFDIPANARGILMGLP